MTRQARAVRGGRANAGRARLVAIPVARLPRPRAVLLAATALQVGMLTVVMLARPARAQSVAPTILPTGGQVIGGTASISRSGNALTIEQSTANAAINWQSFSVGSQASVGFHVPTPQATTINRVIGPDPSVIAGRLTSNGRVVIANQSGIVFAGGAQVDVNTLIASAPGISAANAVAGRLVFDQPARPGAAVINNASITIRQAGLAALVGPTVANNGVISAKLGHVVLAGAAAAVVDFYGDGLLSFDVTKQVARAPGGGVALVTNTGTIVADGGTVQLTAAAVDGLVTNLVEAGGNISAGTGSITIAGTGGDVEIAGQLTARATEPGAAGGTIEVNATGGVALASGAVLDVSGSGGGGVIAVGTTAARAQGGSAVAAPMAASVSIAEGAALHADALDTGPGGHVAVLSAGRTDFAGRVTARGGAQGGNGGMVEISGPALDLSGQVDVTAPAGAVGSILLDPGNVLIQTGGAGSVTNGQTFTADTVLSPTAIEALAGNITLSADGSIDIESNLRTGGTGFLIGNRNFTLLAAGNILVNSVLTGNGTSIVLIAGDPQLGGSAGSVIIGPGGGIANQIDSNIQPGFVALLARNSVTVNGFISTGKIELIAGGDGGAGSVGGFGFVQTNGGTLALNGNIPGPVPYPPLPPVRLSPTPAATPRCPIGGIACVVPQPPFAQELVVAMTLPDYSFLSPVGLAPLQYRDLDVSLPGIARADY